MKNRIAILLATVGLIAFCGCISSKQAGRNDAKKDVAKGVLRLEAWGKGSIYKEEYFDLLSRRYGIEISDAGCLLDDRTIDHAIGYNQIMTVEIERRFGTNSWRQAMNDAKQLHERARQDEPGNK